MKQYFYDLHLHSCLSPCGDDDNTPNNIAGMASLCGLNIVALTDHNSCKNCPAFFEAAKKYGLVPIAGMELTTSEDIHVVCLFEHLSDALRFDNFVEENRIKIQNRPEIFGNQIITDGFDNPIGQIDGLLINATNISVDNICDIVSDFGGICYPAHIDRDSNGIIAILGTLPVDNKFEFFELHDGSKISEYSEKYNIPKERFIVSSDAHYLTNMRDAEFFFDLCIHGDDELEIRRSLFKYLRGDI